MNIVCWSIRRYIHTKPVGKLKRLIGTMSVVPASSGTFGHVTFTEHNQIWRRGPLFEPPV